MQYRVSRHGHDEWVSDGVPSREAKTAAACVTLASLLGADWPEAETQLADEAPDDAEREAALAMFDDDIDAVLRHLRAAMVRERIRRQSRPVCKQVAA